MSTETKSPKNEIVVALTKDHEGCIIVTVFDVHGEQMLADVNAAGWTEPTKLTGKTAVAKSGAIVQLMKKLALSKSQFVANGHYYWSCTKPAQA